MANNKGVWLCNCQWPTLGTLYHNKIHRYSWRFWRGYPISDSDPYGLCSSLKYWNGDPGFLRATRLSWCASVGNWCFLRSQGANLGTPYFSAIRRLVGGRCCYHNLWCYDVLLVSSKKFVCFETWLHLVANQKKNDPLILACLLSTHKILNSELSQVVSDNLYGIWQWNLTIWAILFFKVSFRIK